MINFFFLVLLFCSLFACKEAITQKQNIKDSLSKKDTISDKIETKKITFEDIKGKFLHKNPKLIPMPTDTNFYAMVAEPEHIKTFGDMRQKEIEDLGLIKLVPDYKRGRRKYLAYAIHNFRNGYLIGIGWGGEYFTSIDYFRIDNKGQAVQYCFSLSSAGDGGLRKKDFAIFNENFLEIHDLYSRMYEVTYKKYKLNFLPNFEIKTDTFYRQFRNSMENDLFKEVLRRYSFRVF